MLVDLLNYLLDTSDKKMTIPSSYFNGRNGLPAKIFFRRRVTRNFEPGYSLFLVMIKEWRKRIYFY